MYAHTSRHGIAAMLMPLLTLQHFRPLTLAGVLCALMLLGAAPAYAQAQNSSPSIALLRQQAQQLYRQGRYAEAEPVVRQALAILEQTLGPDHPDVASHLSNLAVLLDLGARYDEAEPVFRRALAINEKTLGPEHPEVAIVLNGLAGVLKNTARYAEA